MRRIATLWSMVVSTKAGQFADVAESAAAAVAGFWFSST